MRGKGFFPAKRDGFGTNILKSSQNMFSRQNSSIAHQEIIISPIMSGSTAAETSVPAGGVTL